MAWRYTPRHGKIDPERCVASVSGERFYPRQCSRPRKEGSEWCGQHAPKEASGKKAYAVYADFSRDLKIVSADIAKETEKRVTLISPGLAFSCKTHHEPDEIDKSPKEAVVRELERVAREKASMEDRLKELVDYEARVKKLFSEIPEEET